MKATLTMYRQSPRKVRLVANLIKGKQVEVAMNVLQFAEKRAGEVMLKLVKSAVDNAKQNFNIEKENLVIKAVAVNSGPILKRSMPRARGSAFRINKRTSHITLELQSK